MGRRPFPPLTELGRVLRELRLARGLTVYCAADACEVGHFTLRSWERGQVIPGAKALGALTALYLVPDHRLFDLASGRQCG